LAIASKFRTLAAKIAPRLDSLAARLIAAAAIWTVLGLAGGGLLLSGVYRTTISQRFDAQLKSDLDELIAAAEPVDNGAISLAGRDADPRYSHIYSGAYWQITPLGSYGIETQSSRSLWDKAIAVTNTRTIDGVTYGYAAGPEDQSLRVLERRIEFASPTGQNTPSHVYMILVAGDQAQIEADSARFNGTLIWSFLVLGLGLIVAIFLQVRIGLRPLRRVSEALARIRDGNARRLEGHFPAEIAPLARELNSLIDHNAEVVTRARTHVSNLAHSLKTPLSVLTSEASAEPGALSDAVSRQVTSMRRQIDHYLSRARAAGALDIIGNRTPVLPVLEDLVRVLKRIHADRGIDIELHCPPNIAFRGERQDLEEMAGNLLDNACKWAKSRVAIGASGRGALLEIHVGDDGPGLEPEDRARVLERGERLDETVPGSGLGLAIVDDISKLYGGELVLGQAVLGGLEVRLKLPATI
jgi:signal transduction histidine kinase